MSNLKLTPQDRQSIDFAEQERIRFENNGKKDRVVVDASNLSNENITSWKNKLAFEKGLEKLYDVNATNGSNLLKITNISNMPNGTYLILGSIFLNTNTSTDGLARIWCKVNALGNFDGMVNAGFTCGNLTASGELTASNGYYYKQYPYFSIADGKAGLQATFTAYLTKTSTGITISSDGNCSGSGFQWGCHYEWSVNTTSNINSLQFSSNEFGVLSKYATFKDTTNIKIYAFKG